MKSRSVTSALLRLCVSSLLVLITISAYGQDCDGQCNRSCRVRLPFGNMVDPACKQSCVTACRANVPVPAVIAPPTPPTSPSQARDDLDRILSGELGACYQVFDSVTKPVIASCANERGREQDGALIEKAKRLLVDKNLLAESDFSGVDIRWCSLRSAEGMSPDENKIFLDVHRKTEDPVDAAVLIAHEMTHIGQYRRLGAARFKCDYSRMYLACRGCQDNRHPLEREAYAREDVVRAKFASTGYPFFVTNQCSRPIRVAIRLYNTSGSWVVNEYSFDAGETAQLDAYSWIADFFYYAEFQSGEAEWKGANEFYANGKTYSMTAQRSNGASHFLTFDCPNFSAPWSPSGMFD